MILPILPGAILRGIGNSRGAIANYLMIGHCPLHPGFDAAHPALRLVQGQDLSSTTGKLRCLH
ncbi:MAG: hypothetical protein KME08_15070 [Aphanothece sp. CMT-3BRIN-NPC111]|nr:hypothetical protein [Aphanothece sp. CMT-3BRIN-NPC111]